MKNLYIITGSCGTGKSSIIPFLKEKYPSIDIYDFDEVGVPDNPTVEWRIETTKYWLNLASQNIDKNKSMILCGLILPKEVEELEKKDILIKLCLLDINKEERTKRLQKRNATEEVINDLEEMYGLRKWVKESKYNSFVIDTSYKTIEKVSLEIIKWIEN